MEASKDKYKLKFSGCCKLTDAQLSEIYNLDQLSDEELASVNLERKSLTDDYRHWHEMSMAYQQEQERIQKLELEMQIDKELELQRQSVLKSLTKPASSKPRPITPAEPIRIFELFGVELRASLPVPDNDSRNIYANVEIVNYDTNEYDSDFMYFDDDRSNEAQCMPNADTDDYDSDRSYEDL